MPNLTLIIKNCKAFKLYINNDKNYCAGDLVWQEGSIDFKKRFHSFSASVIDLLDANRIPESQFEIEANLTKKEGTKDWKGKFFEEIIITSIKLAGDEPKKEWKNPVEDVEEVGNDEIPF